MLGFSALYCVGGSYSRWEVFVHMGGIFAFAGGGWNLAVYEVEFFLIYPLG